MADEKNKAPGDYQVGKGKPPLHSRFKPGNPGRQRGTKKPRADFGEELRKELMKPMRLRQGDRIIEMTTPKLLAQRVKKMLASGSARELEAAYRILEKQAPELLKLAERELRITYHDVAASDVPDPPAELFQEIK